MTTKRHQFSRIMIIAASAARASEIYCQMRDASGEGASTFPEGTWNGHRISYNGRVWEAGTEWPEGNTVYEPTGAGVS